MDDILTDVNESWTAEATGNATGMQQFKGSDDYLRSKVRITNYILVLVFTTGIVRGIYLGRFIISEISGFRGEGREQWGADHWRVRWPSELD